MVFGMSATRGVTMARRGPGGSPTGRPAFIRASLGKGKPSRADVLAMWGSAGRLAATGGVDLLAQLCGADRANHHVAAGHVARRAVEPERLGELEAFLERLLDLVAGEILFDAADVEANVLRRRQRACLVGLAASAQQLLMELEILLAGLILHTHRDRDLRRLDGAGAEDREFLEHDAQIAVSLHHLEKIGQRVLAVAAVVIEELDQRDVALRV